MVFRVGLPGGEGPARPRLTSALDIVSFIEGRRPGGSLPNTVSYRLILPYFSFWWTAFLVIVCGSMIVLIFWTRTV